MLPVTGVVIHVWAGLASTDSKAMQGLAVGVPYSLLADGATLGGMTKAHCILSLHMVVKAALSSLAFVTSLSEQAVHRPVLPDCEQESGVAFPVTAVTDGLQERIKSRTFPDAVRTTALPTLCTKSIQGGIARRLSRIG